MFKLGANSLKNRQGVDPRLIEIDDLAIQITLVDFGHGPYAGMRSADVQYTLYTQGLSKCDGYEKLSNHQSGRALDFYAFVDGRASWEPLHLAMVASAYLQAAIILGYKIQWGGLWERRNPKNNNERVTGWDMPHIELIDE